MGLSVFVLYNVVKMLVKTISLFLQAVPAEVDFGWIARRINPLEYHVVDVHPSPCLVAGTERKNVSCPPTLLLGGRFHKHGDCASTELHSPTHCPGNFHCEKPTTVEFEDLQGQTAPCRVDAGAALMRNPFTRFFCVYSTKIETLTYTGWCRMATTKQKTTLDVTPRMPKRTAPQSTGCKENGWLKKKEAKQVASPPTDTVKAHMWGAENQNLTPFSRGRLCRFGIALAGNRFFWWVNCLDFALA